MYQKNDFIQYFKTFPISGIGKLLYCVDRDINTLFPDIILTRLHNRYSLVVGEVDSSDGKYLVASHFEHFILLYPIDGVLFEKVGHCIRYVFAELEPIRICFHVDLSKDNFRSVLGAEMLVSETDPDLHLILHKLENGTVMEEFQSRPEGRLFPNLKMREEFHAWVEKKSKDISEYLGDE